MANQNHNNRKLIPVIAAAVLVVIVIALLPVISKSLKSGSTVSESNTTTLGSVTGMLDTDNETETEGGTEDMTEAESESESETEELSSGGSYSGGSYSGGSSSGDSSSGGSSSGSSSVESGISFPYTSSLDGVRLDAVYNYSGYYIEDGSEDEISSVAALEVTNVSGEAMEYANITLSCGGTTLTFEISLLPAGATVLVMEADRQSCSNTSAISYEGTEVAALSSFDLCEDQVSITTDENGGITVTNISSETIDELRLFYKNRIDSGEYIGGIAYTVKIEDLEAGASQTVYPSHYDPEYGVVMMVRTY